MLKLNPQADLQGITAALQNVLADCIERWRTSGVPLLAEDEIIVLLEPGDTIHDLAALVGILTDDADEEFVPPAEWTTDLGEAWEMYVAFSDDGNGVSLILPKDGTDPQLCRLFADYATPPTGSK